MTYAITRAFQARPFYEPLGFSVFGQIDGRAPTFPRVVTTVSYALK